MDGTEVEGRCIVDFNLFEIAEGTAHGLDANVTLVLVFGHLEFVERPALKVKMQRGEGVSEMPGYGFAKSCLRAGQRATFHSSYGRFRNITQFLEDLLFLNEVLPHNFTAEIA